MNKKYCDRCGNEITETKRNMFDMLCDAVATLKVNFGGKHRIEYSVQIIDIDDPQIPRPIADLCEQCKHELTAFMNYTLKAAEERHLGEWIHTDECDEEFQYRCSNCNLPIRSNSHFFCPNCGANMRKEGESDEDN